MEGDKLSSPVGAEERNGEIVAAKRGKMANIGSETEGAVKRVVTPLPSPEKGLAARGGGVQKKISNAIRVNHRFCWQISPRESQKRSSKTLDKKRGLLNSLKKGRRRGGLKRL